MFNAEAALVPLEGAWQPDPRNERVLFRLAGVQFDMKHFDLARETVMEAIRQVPSEWSYYYLKPVQIKVLCFQQFRRFTRLLKRILGNGLQPKLKSARNNSVCASGFMHRLHTIICLG